MLTRLKVKGFKNLDDVDVRFGPFTCIAGGNGVGKSNLFDAIRFLALLAQKPLLKAARAVRGADDAMGGVERLFNRHGGVTAKTMSFEAEFLIPESGRDGLNQPMTASATYLRYALELRRTPKSTKRPFEIVRESLVPLNESDAKNGLGFAHSDAWRASVVRGRRTEPYIQTDDEGLISRFADSETETGARSPSKIRANELPTTMLSSMNDGDTYRTAVLAKREIRAWFILSLEPSRLRRPDPIFGPTQLSFRGSHLAATLLHMHISAEDAQGGDGENLYARIANRLSNLIDGVREIRVEVDPTRDFKMVMMTDRSGTEHSAASLSDGTLRFLALAVMEANPQSRGLICMEEPENGLHPARIPAMLDLLMDMAVDSSLPVGGDNPLRQVIINTHSPALVAAVPDDRLLVARVPRSTRANGLVLQYLSGTWRHQLDPKRWTVAPGHLAAYLNPIPLGEEAYGDENGSSAQRVLDRADLKFMSMPSDGRTIQ